MIAEDLGIAVNNLSQLHDRNLSNFRNSWRLRLRKPVTWQSNWVRHRKTSIRS